MAKIIKPNPTSRSARAAGVRAPKAPESPKTPQPQSSDEEQATVTPIDLNAALTRLMAERAWAMYRRTGHPLNAWQVVVRLLKADPSEPLPKGPREFLIKFGSEMIKSNEKPHQLNAQNRLAIAEEIDLCLRQDRGRHKVRGIPPRPKAEVYAFIAERRGSTPKEVESIAREFGLTKKRGK